MSPSETKTPRIAILGSGFAGLGMAIALKRAGVESFTVFERASSLGGTWRDNTYPGAACDVPSLLYSYSFAPNPRWTHHYATQEEILAYLEQCADTFGVRPHLRFNTEVVAARFDEAGGTWELELGSGERERADVVVLACGALSRPSRPGLPGLERFAGRVLHSARWAPGEALAGERVAVIGTGASAIQIVPRLAERVGQLHVFQRTPPWILPKDDRPLPAWERWLYAALPAVRWLRRQAIYWRLEIRVPLFTLATGLPRLVEWMARRHLARSVAEPGLRARLTPDYVLGCKRVLLSNDYYPALQRPHVELVTEPIEALTPEGVRTRDGQVRPVDTVVLATGFQSAEDGTPFPIWGRGGRRLDEVWRSAPEAFLGTAVAGMPNLFFLVGPNSSLGHSSMVFMIESQVRYVLGCVQALSRGGLTSLEVREDVQARFNAGLMRRLARSVWNRGGCTSWYTTRTGRNTALWPGFTFEFRWRTRRPVLKDFHVRSPNPEPSHVPPESAP